MTRRGAVVGATLACVLALAAWSGCAAPAESPPSDDESPSTAAPVEGVFGRAPAASGGVPSVVALTPHGPVEVEWPESPVIDQLGLQFSPRRLIVPVGREVRFHNSETLAHNVNLTSIATGATVFNGDSPPNESLTFTFEEAGGYHVLCETHPGMSAFVFVTGAPYAAIADDEGTFRVVDVLPGEYTLTVWSAVQNLRSEQTIVVESGRATEVHVPPLG